MDYGRPPELSPAPRVRAVLFDPALKQRLLKARDGNSEKRERERVSWYLYLGLCVEFIISVYLGLS